MCVHAARFQACHCHKSYIRRAICDLTFAHFLEQNSQKMPFFILKTILERPYPVLEHLFLFQYVLSCFRTCYSVSEQQKKCLRIAENIWTCEVHASDPKTVASHPFVFIQISHEIANATSKSFCPHCDCHPTVVFCDISDKINYCYKVLNFQTAGHDELFLFLFKKSRIEYTQ